MQTKRTILVEKPLCMKTSEAEIIQAVARHTGTTVMVGHLLRYHPAFIEMERLVQEKYLGELRYIYANRLNLGRVREHENVWWSFAPHDISMVLALGDSKCRRAWGKGWKRPGRSVYDSTVTFMELENGIEAHIFVSWLHPVKRHELVCLCERGMIVFNDCAEWERKIEVYESTVAEPLGRKDFKSGFEIIGQKEPLECEIEHFLECVDDTGITGRSVKPRTEIAEGIAVVKVLGQVQQFMEAIEYGRNKQGTEAAD